MGTVLKLSDRGRNSVLRQGLLAAAIAYTRPAQDQAFQQGRGRGSQAPPQLRHCGQWMASGEGQVLVAVSPGRLTTPQQMVPRPRV